MYNKQLDSRRSHRKPIDWKHRNSNVFCLSMFFCCCILWVFISFYSLAGEAYQSMYCYKNGGRKYVESKLSGPEWRGVGYCEMKNGNQCDIWLFYMHGKCENRTWIFANISQNNSTPNPIFKEKQTLQHKKSLGRLTKKENSLKIVRKRKHKKKLKKKEKKRMKNLRKRLKNKRKRRP